MTAFERFFTIEFQALLDEVRGEPGLFTSSTARIEDASWDRKAAYLLWREKRRARRPVEDDII